MKGADCVARALDAVRQAAGDLHVAQTLLPGELSFVANEMCRSLALVELRLEDLERSTTHEHLL